MPFRLIEVTTDEQFEKMMPSYWAAFNNPRSVGLELNFPIKGDGPEAVAAAIEDCKKRMMSAWHGNPVGHYIQILDDENNDAVVGSAYWCFYDNEHNRWMNEREDDKDCVTWWPAESEIRKYTMMQDEQKQVPKLERQKKPHVCK